MEGPRGTLAVVTHIGHEHFTLPAVQHLLQLLVRHHPSIGCNRKGQVRGKASSALPSPLGEGGQNSLILSCLRMRSTFFSRYSDCIELHLLMSSTNCCDRTPC